MSKKQLLLIHTGGTISMQNNESGDVIREGANPIAAMRALPGVDATITVAEPYTVPSTHVTLAHMMTVKTIIESSNADAFVITHGTDTMEETAYFLQLTLDCDKPVVLTGAMRSSNDVSADGPANLIAAAKTAVSAAASGKGVLVVMNDSIHYAEAVTKTNCGSLDSFQSPGAGPAGTVLKSGPHFHGEPAPYERFSVSKPESIRVPLLKAYAGMDGDIIRSMGRFNGIVIEAFGQGNIPPPAAAALLELIKEGIPVVVASRCESGIVQPVYSYEGGGAVLKKAGAFFAGALNGQKARLKLIAALDAGVPLEACFSR